VKRRNGRRLKIDYAVPEGGLRQADRPFCVLNFNPCEISEQNSVRIAIFHGNTQRWTANTVRCPLLVFTVTHDFTLNAETRYAFL
jgi:hypothetical protein